MTLETKKSVFVELGILSQFSEIILQKSSVLQNDRF
jgi:hypothetical protein